MKRIRSSLQAGIGLFVGDGSLALALAGWVAVSALILPRVPIGRTWGALMLTAGCCVVFVVNVTRGARQNRPVV
jgi:hypothetical protein